VCTDSENDNKRQIFYLAFEIQTGKLLGHRRKEGKNQIHENQPEMEDDEKYLITSF